jgi:kinesin family protein 5
MMAGFDLGGEVFSDNERSIRRIIEQLDQLHEMSSAGEAIAPDSLQELREKLVETQGIVRQAELSLTARNDEDGIHSKRREALEARCSDLQSSYEQLLEQNLSEADKEELKSRLAEAYTARQEGNVELVDDLKQDLARKAEDNSRLRLRVYSSESRVARSLMASRTASTARLFSSKLLNSIT